MGCIRLEQMTEYLLEPLRRKPLNVHGRRSALDQTACWTGAEWGGSAHDDQGWASILCPNFALAQNYRAHIETAHQFSVSPQQSQQSCQPRG